MSTKEITTIKSSTEIDALIETLHGAEQRLEELTAGEVDAVVSRRGRTTLLRLAQIQLRESEAVKQAAILDALPARVALLDGQGRIVSVNLQWRRSSGANAVVGLGYEVGSNYPDSCNATPGIDLSEARRIAGGVRSVLEGELKSFSIEYPCGPETSQRWYILTVTPLADDHTSGAVVMHVDVTAERRTEQNLRISEARFRQMAQSVEDAFFLRNLDSTEIYYMSPAYETIWGRTCDSLYSNPVSWAESIHPDDRDWALTYFSEHPREDFDLNLRIIRADGEVRWIHTRGHPILDDAGQPYRIAGVASDITKRKQDELKIRHLNRVYAVHSQISALTVRVREREHLFREACRIAVEAGAFKMAWIGVIDPKTLDGEIVAWSGGKADYLARIKITAREHTPESEEPASRALRLSTPVICNDVATDTSLGGVLRDRLLARGDKSVACFPLTTAGRIGAVLTLYAAEPHAFDAEETHLLLELASNLSFALEHVAKQERLDYLAYYDQLTGLANRGLFLERVSQYIRSSVGGEHKLALGLIDLERFKNINLTFGRAAADRFLKEVADWLASRFGDVNLLARVGADHFAIVLPELSDAHGLERRISASMEDLSKHSFSLDDAAFHIAAKVGVSLFPDDGTDADTLFRHAEAALAKAKVTGDRHLFYAERMTATVAGRLNLENQLREAIDRDQFVLHYQPKVSFMSGKITGAEALIRWNDPRMGLTPPAKFIPMLEQTGLIHEVGRWAIRKVLEDHLRWRNAGLPAIRIAANVSALQLRSHSFLEELRETLSADAYAAAGLELEITESLIMDNVGLSIDRLQAIRALGVTIAIDDFGTGFSSLSYLSRLAVDTLKIDRSFVSDMTAGNQGRILVSAIISLAHSLKLNVVAEGVETIEQSNLLKTLGCDELQGYLFSEPVPVDVFEARFVKSTLIN
jgi:diguanylate cyclase (GGDEF)-like protein/PAS domain S-box-containing protein